jgi:hypothetical protein
MAGVRPNMTLTSAKGCVRAGCRAGGRPVKTALGMKCKAMMPVGAGRAGVHTIGSLPAAVAAG